MQAWLHQAECSCPSPATLRPSTPGPSLLLPAPPQAHLWGRSPPHPPPPLQPTALFVTPAPPPTLHASPPVATIPAPSAAAGPCRGGAPDSCATCAARASSGTMTVQLSSSQMEALEAAQKRRSTRAAASAAAGPAPCTVRLRGKGRISMAPWEASSQRVAAAGRRWRKARKAGVCRESSEAWWVQRCGAGRGSGRQDQQQPQRRPQVGPHIPPVLPTGSRVPRAATPS